MSLPCLFLCTVLITNKSYICFNKDGGIAKIYISDWVLVLLFKKGKAISYF